jgi:hypothetical protein
LFDDSSYAFDNAGEHAVYRSVSGPATVLGRAMMRKSSPIRRTS